MPNGRQSIIPGGRTRKGEQTQPRRGHGGIGEVEGRRPFDFRGQEITDPLGFLGIEPLTDEFLSRARAQGAPSKRGKPVTAFRPFGGGGGGERPVRPGPLTELDKPLQPISEAAAEVMVGEGGPISRFDPARRTISEAVAGEEGAGRPISRIDDVRGRSMLAAFEKTKTALEGIDAGIPAVEPGQPAKVGGKRDISSEERRFNEFRDLSETIFSRTGSFLDLLQNMGISRQQLTQDYQQEQQLRQLEGARADLRLSAEMDEFGLAAIPTTTDLLFQSLLSGASTAGAGFIRERESRRQFEEGLFG